MKRRVASPIRVLILCEGVTEEVYAKALRSEYLPRELQRTVTVDVVRHKQNDPLNLVNEAKDRVAKAKKARVPYNHVWLFFDHDNFPKLRKVFEEVDKHGFKPAFTAISLEYWFILHYEDCGKVFLTGDECVRHLKKSWPLYHKTQINHFKELGNYVKRAIERAEKLEIKNKDVHIWEAQPYTTVHHLITFFKELGTKG